MEIYDKIKTMRQINQLTQEEMAEKLAMSTNGYSKIERGQSKLSLDKLEQIAHIFNIDVIELMNAKDNGLICLIGDNNSSNYSNYLGTSEALAAENDKLKLVIQHKEEMLQKQRDEIATLKELIGLLKNPNQ